MTKQNKLQLLLTITTLGIAMLLLADDTLARAGGGGGGFSGGGSYSGSSSGGSSGAAGFWSLVLAPFFMLISGIATYVARKKNIEAKALMEQISQRDAMWDLNNIKARIEKVYFKVQIAWRERDQDMAREYMSQRLYDKHKLQTDDLLRNKTKNMLENINLKEAMIVEILDYKDDSRDSFWALIKGEMIDYTIDDDTGEVIKGSTDTPESFEELWRFKREPHGWVLDEIDQEVSLSDFRGFRPFSEEVA